MADVRVVTSEDPVSEAGRIVAAALTEIDVSRGAARLAIPGGSAMNAVGVVRCGLAPAVWRRIRLTWADERCVPSGDRDSNRGEAYRSDQLDPAAPTEIELPLWLDGEAPERACRRVDAGLQRSFSGALDVVLLGMGQDGHVASLFPGHKALRAEGLVTAVDDSPKPPALRLTLTVPLLNTARTTVLLAMGTGKRAALARLVRGDVSLPAAALRNVTIVTDLDLGGTR